jgi:hypothetical protein
MLIIFFDIKGIVHEKFILACQTFNFAYYCDVLRQLHENLPRTQATKELAVASQQCTASYFLFCQGIFLPKTLMLSPPTPLFSVSLTEDKTERQPF